MDRNSWPGLWGVWRFLLNCWGEGSILIDRKESEMRRKAMELTAEEKKTHARLIQECRERERRLALCQRENEEGIHVLMAHLNHLANVIELIDQHLKEANERLAEVILLYMPDSEIPHA